MRVLALQAFDGGSHRQVLQGWQAHSRNDFHTLNLPGHHWKWRMRHAAWTFAEQSAGLDATFDAIWCTDMLDLASWRGLTSESLRQLPCIWYAHENQLTYPDADRSERDLHFAFTNLLSAAAADAVWWNSAYHRDEFCTAMRRHLRRLPDHAPRAALDRIENISRILPPGFTLDITAEAPASEPTDRPCHLLWAARWEDDKGPEILAAALRRLLREDHSFVISIIGGPAKTPPACFAPLPELLGNRLRHWGWRESRADFEAVLAEADLVISTARHEFFGLALVEAVAAGCRPLVPRALAYPEVLAELVHRTPETNYFHTGTAADLTAQLRTLLLDWAAGRRWRAEAQAGMAAMQRYRWSTMASAWDQELDLLADNHNSKR